MIDDWAHLFTVVFGQPIVIMVGGMIGWMLVEGVLTVLLWPWRNR